MLISEIRDRVALSCTRTILCTPFPWEGSVSLGTIFTVSGDRKTMSQVSAGSKYWDDTYRMRMHTAGDLRLRNLAVPALLL